jgi:hypothetical protein
MPVRMTRTGALVLMLANCFLLAHTADLKCEDITHILSGNLLVSAKPPTWWYGHDRTPYKNRDCDKCHLDYGGTDCKDNSCPFMSGPLGQSIDLLPADSETWICPRFCASMPLIPIKLTVRKTQSRWSCEGNLWIHGVCVSPQFTHEDQMNPVPYDLPMTTAFKTADASADSYRESTDLNTYAVRPISLCKKKRYQDNFNSRCSCRQWQGTPVMTHLNVFWTGGEAMSYTFLGTRDKKQTISQCKSINDVEPLHFKSEPCWIGDVAPAQQNKQFSIKPYYTHYRSRQSTAAPHDCRMRIIGDYDGQDNSWTDSALLPPDSEWNINRYWGTNSNRC